MVLNNDRPEAVSRPKLLCTWYCNNCNYVKILPWCGLPLEFCWRPYISTGQYHTTVSAWCMSEKVKHHLKLTPIRIMCVKWHHKWQTFRGIICCSVQNVKISSWLLLIPRFDYSKLGGDRLNVWINGMIYDLPISLYYHKQPICILHHLFLATVSERNRTSLDIEALAPPNGNIFRVTGPLWGEFTGHRWIPLT